MKKLGFLPIFLFSFLSAISQNKDTAYIDITNFRLAPGTYSFRSTNTFHDMTSWNSSAYTEGHLQGKGSNGIWSFRQNYRLLYPGGYDPNYEPGFPMIVMLHGGGERGNCWNGDCYCEGSYCNPGNPPNDSIKATIDPRFLNNDHVLTHGGSAHLSAVNLAGTKKPNDPSLNIRAFPGFVFFPQNQNTWGGAYSASSELSYAIRTIRLLCKQLNIDENRIYIHGLSLGGQAVYKALNMADWLFAGAATMSALNSTSGTEYDSVKNIPLWAFQGGQDKEPYPSETEALIKRYRDAGGNAKYTLYPTLGHGTWNTAYNEPDFFYWLLSQNKSNIHVNFGNPNICSTTGSAAQLFLTQGFYAYQWERDGVIIPGATSHTYAATIPGVYRARFSRISANPTEAQWNQWSAPVTIGETSPPEPQLTQTGTVILSDLNNNRNAYLTGPAGYEYYYWYKNDVLTTLPNTSAVTIGGCATAPCPNTGKYTLVTAGIDKCPSPPSKPKYVVQGIHSQPAAITQKPTGFTGQVTSPSSVLLRWTDVSTNERGYEIWRSKSTEAAGTGWKMAVLTEEDVTLFHDTGLAPNTTYYYKIRGVNNVGRSDYTPNNNKTNLAHNLIITTSADASIPTPPQNLTATSTALNTITLTWEPSTDDSGVKSYYIFNGSDSVLSNSTATTFVIDSLPLNTIFNFRVKAVDVNNNLSSFSNQATANTYVDGLYYEHSTGAFTDVRNIVWTNPEFTGRVSNFSLEPRTQDDFFNFRYYGYLYIQTAGTYTFRLNSNDGSQLYLDNGTTPLISRNGIANEGQCTSSASTARTLTAGPHFIEVRYFDATGSHCLEVYYKGPDTGTGSNPPYIAIPSSKLKSYNTITPPTPPAAPTDLIATAASMTEIDLKWKFAAASVNFEIYRATSSGGPFTMVSSIDDTVYRDKNLIPGTIYYYKVRTVNGNGASVYTALVNATTLADEVAPSAPTGVAISSATYTKVSLVWTASTDNVKVTDYEVWANNNLQGTASTVGYVADNLTPNTLYNFFVIARDASGNRSQASATVSATTSNPDTYYSLASGNLNDLGTWGKNPDGTGDTAKSFSNNGQHFIVSNRTTSALGGSWQVEGPISKVIVSDNVTLTVDNNFTARVEIPGNGVLNLNHSSVPEIVSLSPQSTVNYNTPTTVLPNTYGHLILSGTGNKVFASGTTSVLGNLTVSNGIVLKGATNNESQLSLNGDLTINGSPGFTAPDFGIQLSCAKSGIQTISTGGDLYFDKITATGSNTVINVTSTGSPININLGSYTGGGIALANGSKLSLGNNNLILTRAASINPNNETGEIAINDGDIRIASSSNTSSNLYFDAVQNAIKHLELNLTGSGDAIVREPVKVTEALKMKNGELQTGGFITLASTAAKTANIQEIEGNGKITGDVKVQRYMNPKGKLYRYISTPVEGITIGDWQTYFPIGGAFTGANGGATPTLFIYDEPTGYVAYPTTSTSAPIEKGKGYSVYFRNGTSALTIVNTGNPYQGNVTFTLEGGTGADDGWNLLGNPYASTIAWSNNPDAWIKTNINSTVSVRNNLTPTTGQFEYFNAATNLGSLTGGKIAPGQAFWVQATAANPSLTITEKAKSTEQQVIYRDATAKVSHIKVSLQGGSISDAAFIAFTDFGTDEFDLEFDALKRENIGLFNLSSFTAAGNKALAINSMNDNFCEKEVRLNITGVSPGSYRLSFEALESLVGINTVTLFDHADGVVIDLNVESEYSFKVTQESKSFGANRFSIKFSRPAIHLTPKISATNVCEQSALVKIADAQPGVEYTALNENSDVISEAVEATSGEDVVLTIPQSFLKEGFNTIHIRAGFEGCGSQILPSPTVVGYAITPEITVENTSVCEGSSARLTVSGAPEGSTYQWYTDNLEQIKGATTQTFETSPIYAETQYLVSTIHPYGCKIPQQIVTVQPEVINTPAIQAVGDTLFSTERDNLQWYRNGEVLVDETNVFFIPKTSGVYTVSRTQGGCTKTSAGREMIITSNELGTGVNFKLEVYPNPASSNNINLRVQSNVKQSFSVKVIDLMGRTLHREMMDVQTAEEGVRIAPRNGLTAGVYFLVIDQAGRSEKVKFIIKE